MNQRNLAIIVKKNVVMEDARMKTVQVRALEIGKGMPKICAPILGETEKEFVDSATKGKDSIADLFELRIDWYEKVEEIESVLSLLKKVREIIGEKPLLFTFRTAKEGGKKALSKEEYEHLNTKVSQSGFIDLLDVELELGEDLVRRLILEAHKNGVKVIASNHDFESTPSIEEIQRKLKRMDVLGADILKMAVYPQSKQDVLRLMLATSKMKDTHTEKPLITMAMGQEGLISRLSGEIFGSSITFGSITKASAPGQISVDSLKDSLTLLHIEEKKLLFLVGFMGAGKSTIAKNLAKKQKLPLIEMDEELVRMEGKSISDIFEQSGELYFRDLESQLISEIVKKEKAIISCGGGVMLRNENIEIMKKNGRIVYLKASPETIYERVKDNKERPILNGNMNVASIRSLMEKRCETYEREADVRVETDGKTVNQICDELIRIL